MPELVITFNGWVVSRRDCRWHLLVQEVLSGPTLGSGLGLCGGRTAPGEPLAASVDRELARLELPPPARTEELDATDYAADEELDTGPERIVDILIEVDSADTPAAWEEDRDEPDVPFGPWRLRWRWADLGDAIRIESGRGIGDMLRRRLGVRGPVASTVVKWRPAGGAAEADPREVAKALLNGRGHPAAAALSLPALSDDFAHMIPPRRWLHDPSGQIVGVAIEQSADASEHDRAFAHGWALSAWLAEGVAAYDVERGRYYPPFTSPWWDADPAVGDLPNLWTRLDGLLAALLDATDRPGQVVGTSPPFDAAGRAVNWHAIAPDRPRWQDRAALWPLPANQSALRAGRVFGFAGDYVVLDAAVDVGALLGDGTGTDAEPRQPSEPGWPERLRTCGWAAFPGGGDNLFCLVVADPSHAWLVDALRRWCDANGRERTRLWRRGDELLGTSTCPAGPQ